MIRHGFQTEHRIVVDVSKLALFNADIPGESTSSKAIIFLKQINSIHLCTNPTTKKQKSLLDGDIFQFISQRVHRSKTFSIEERPHNTNDGGTSVSHHFTCTSAQERQQLILKLLHHLNEMGRAPQMGLLQSQYKVMTMKSQKRETLRIDIERGRDTSIKRRRLTEPNLFRNPNDRHLNGRASKNWLHQYPHRSQKYHRDVRKRKSLFVPNTIAFRPADESKALYQYGRQLANISDTFEELTYLWIGQSMVILPVLLRVIFLMLAVFVGFTISNHMMLEPVTTTTNVPAGTNHVSNTGTSAQWSNMACNLFLGAAPASMSHAIAEVWCFAPLL